METSECRLDGLIYQVIGCVIEVHKQLGPGFLEKVYRRATALELERQGIRFEEEKEIQLQYKGNHIGRQGRQPMRATARTASTRSRWSLDFVKKFTILRVSNIGTHRLDLLVENELVIELKTVEELHKKHYAQVRSYLKAIQKPIGLLVNFAEFQLNARRVELTPQAQKCP
jgi:hypothetical protein